MLLISFGSHLPHGPVPAHMSAATYGEKLVNRTFDRWLSTLEANQYKGTVVWMEYFAGHFDTPTGEFPGLYQKDVGGKGDVRCSTVTPDASRQSPRFYTANERALSAGWRLWPVNELSAARHDGHIEWASRISYRNISYIDCRHFCFPGAVLEARNEQLLALLDSGCV